MKQQTVTRIIATTKAMEEFWRHAHGWALKDAAELLASARAQGDELKGDAQDAQGDSLV